MCGNLISRVPILQDFKFPISHPKNTKNAQRFRVKELGGYNRKRKTYGDLYLEANVVLPDCDSLPKEFQEALEKYL